MLDKAEAHIREIYQSRVDKGKMSQAELLDKMDLIEFTLDYADFEDVDIVIEAVPEEHGAQAARSSRSWTRCCHEGAIFASNTSALSIEEMGAATSRPAARSSGCTSSARPTS